MFQPQPPAGQRRHRRLPSGTVVSYAEVKSYLSKREIPQLFESLMAGLMYHRPENHIGYLQSCLDEVKTNSETKVHWSTFVNKKRKSKEILPPLTPKKQDSFSSSWSDNSRQSTPLPPISARTRTRTNPEQQDLRNTYILYHNPPPILAKPKVPVISVLGGLGARIDELCEKVVGRLRGVVHISTCSMLKTRMTIEGFYRVTSVPACAVVDSVLQAMSMVQSENALLVAGFPRNRGDIEEYRSRRVRMDGVVLVDFEEEALRRFLDNEVSNGAIRLTDVETELERYKQDIISVAEYYDEKELLTVVMGDQDTEEMIEDMVIAIDKIIETRKDISECDSVIDAKDPNCGKESPCKTLVSAPHSADRPSTVEIRDATEEDIKSIEAESRNSKRIDDDDGADEKDSQNGTKEEVDQDQAKVSENGSKEEDNEKHVSESNQKNSDESDRVSQNSGTNQSFKSEVKFAEVVLAVLETSAHESSKESEHSAKTETNSQQSNETKPSKIPIVFAFENIKTDYDVLKDLIVDEMGMCYINFYELVRNDGEENDRLGTNESINLLQSVLKQDSVSYSNGFFISDFPFDLLKESKFENILKLGEVSFVCKVKEKSFEANADEKKQPEEVLFESPMSEKVRIIFVTESNIMNELKSTLQEMVGNKKPHAENSIEKQSDVENNIKNGEAGQENDLEKTSALIDKEEKVESENSGEGDSPKKLEVPLTIDEEANGVHDNAEILQKSESKVLENGDIPASNIEMEVVNQESITEDKTSTADNEDSTCRDVDDLITDDTLNERTKPDESLKTEESKDVSLKEGAIEDLSSPMNEEGEEPPVEIQKEKGVLSRQQNLDIETPSVSDNSIQLNKNENTESENEVKTDDSEVSEVKSPLKRQGTYSSIPERFQDEGEVKTETSETTQESGEAENEQEIPKEEVSSPKEQAPQNLISGEENKETADTNAENDDAQETKNKEEESSEIVEKGDKSEQSEVVADEAEMNNADENEKDTNSEAEQDVNKDNDSINENQKEENHSAEEKSGPGNETNKNSEEEEKTGGTDDDDEKETDQSHGEEEKKTNETGNGDEKEADQSHDEEEKKTDGAGNGDEKEATQEDGEEEEEKVVQADDVENKTSQEDGEDEEKAVQTDDEENKTSQADGDKEGSTDQVDDEANKTSQADGEENKTNEADVEKEPESESKENLQDNEENTEFDEKDVKNSSNDADYKPSETTDEVKVDDDAPEKASDVKQEENSIDGEAIDSASETKNDENPADGETGDKVSDIKDGENAEDDKDSSEGRNDESVVNSEAEGIEDKNNKKEENPTENDIKDGENAADDKGSSELKNDESIVNSEEEGIEVTNNNSEDNSTKNETSSTTEKESGTGEDGENQQASENSEESESKQTSENDTTKVEKTEIAEEAKENDEENKETNTTKDEAENQEVNSSAETFVLGVDDANTEKKNSAEDESADKTDNEEPIDTVHQKSTENSEDNGTVILKSMDDSDSNDEKSVTIETKAEVHAPDSLSPLLVQSTDEAKIEKGDADEEDNSAKEREEKNNDQNSENGSILQNESALESTDESQTTTENEMVITQNERFSGKHQERNGSGILGESRQEDHPEAEQQERSSSSSRGEL